MRTVYNLLFPCLFALLSPYYFFRLWRRGNWRKGFSQRFGYYDEKIKRFSAGQDLIWIHAVSVGEIILCAELVRVLESLQPNLRFLVSTTTTTGMGELQKRLPKHIAKVYYPIDFPTCVRRVLESIKPKAIIFVEAEIWPNFIWQAADRRIPLFLANARISDRSYPRYLKLPFLFRRLFASFGAVGAQCEEYASRLRDVGCEPANVEVTGNIKFDTAKLSNANALDAGELLAQIGVPKSTPILLGASTHNGEEHILASQFQDLRKQCPDLFLILVPRHFERAREVGRVLDRCGLKFMCRSQILSATKMDTGTLDCLLVDTTGELMSFYQQASVVFVGKSIKAKGGQNPIEPAVLGRATVFGPNMQNFADVARIFVAGNGAIQVRDIHELKQSVAKLLSDSKHRTELGTRAQQIVHENQGALARTANMILRRLQTV